VTDYELREAVFNLIVFVCIMALGFGGYVLWFILDIFREMNKDAKKLEERRRNNG